MENASNALWIAAGVLVGIMLVTTIVVSFSGASELASTYDATIAKNSLQAFNSNFEKYTMVNAKLREIITLAHFAIDFNAKNDFEENDAGYIHVILYKNNELNKKTEKELIDYMTEKGNNFKLSEDGKEELIGNYQEYKCIEIEYNELTGLVNRIVFKKVE